MVSRRKGHALLGWVGEDAASRWVSLICLLVWFAVLASGASRGRPGTSTAAGGSMACRQCLDAPRWWLLLNGFCALPLSRSSQLTPRCVCSFLATPPLAYIAERAKCAASSIDRMHASHCDKRQTTNGVLALLDHTMLPQGGQEGEYRVQRAGTGRVALFRL